MVPNPWYIGNNALNQENSSNQLSLPFGLENSNRISKKNKIGISKRHESNSWQNVVDKIGSEKHLQKLLDLVKRSSVQNCHANGKYL